MACTHRHVCSSHKQTQPGHPQEWTQRKLVGLISRLFDPLEITAPVTIAIKIKVQEIWRNGQHWDKELPEDLEQSVEDWATNSANLNEIQVPRFYNLQSAQPIELHVFCDASTQALATVIFIQFADKITSSSVRMATTTSIHQKHNPANLKDHTLDWQHSCPAFDIQH